jgi:hypothetical protein
MIQHNGRKLRFHFLPFMVKEGVVCRDRLTHALPATLQVELLSKKRIPEPHRLEFVLRQGRG